MNDTKCKECRHNGSCSGASAWGEVCYGPNATMFTMAERDDRGESYSDAYTSMDVDTPESLGEWALELGDYHHHAYHHEITHLDQIDERRLYPTWTRSM